MTLKSYGREDEKRQKRESNERVTRRRYDEKSRDKRHEGYHAREREREERKRKAEP